MVGRGTYGTVCKAEVRLHGKSSETSARQKESIRMDYRLAGTVALKELNFVSPTPSQYQAFRNEVIALKFVAFIASRSASMAIDFLQKNHAPEYAELLRIHAGAALRHCDAVVRCETLFITSSSSVIHTVYDRVQHCTNTFTFLIVIGKSLN